MQDTLDSHCMSHCSEVHVHRCTISLQCVIFAENCAENCAEKCVKTTADNFVKHSVISFAENCAENFVNKEIVRNCSKTKSTNFSTCFFTLCFRRLERHVFSRFGQARARLIPSIVVGLLEGPACVNPLTSLFDCHRGLIAPRGEHRVW